MAGKEQAPVSLETVLWQPQPRQESFITCPFDDVLFGGARGGGKTDATIGDWIDHQFEYGRQANGVIFRKTVTELEDMIRRALELLPPLGAKWNDQKKRFIMPNGAQVKFRYLEREQDAMGYQGHNYTRVHFEELGNWATSKGIDLMYATLRSAYGIPCRMRATANPGGPGHQWVKERYITPAPLGFAPIPIKLPSGRVFTRCYIPSRLSDNQELMANDPSYQDRLYLVGSAALVKAWMEGDWDAVEGAYFDSWSSKMVIPPFAIPQRWTKFRSFDWGYARPFSVGWWAITDGEPVVLPDGTRVRFPRGAMIRYREWYGCVPGQPNTGVRLEAEDIAAGILKMEGSERIDYGVADPSIWDASKGPSIAERMGNFKIKGSDRRCAWRRGDNKRLTGWSQVRGRMKPSDEGRPMIYVFGTCIDSIRLMPVMQHSKTKPEDLDTDMEDHIADEWRYACMSRPMPHLVPAKRNLGPNPLSMDGMAPVVIQSSDRINIMA
jgi:hypothetical protein